MNAKQDKNADLLNKIRTQIPTVPPGPAITHDETANFNHVDRDLVPNGTPRSSQQIAQRHRPTRKEGSRGEGQHIYLHPEDKDIIQDLRRFLTIQGARRVNDSLVIKAALRAVKQDNNLFQAYKSALELSKGSL